VGNWLLIGIFRDNKPSDKIQKEAKAMKSEENEKDSDKNRVNREILS
jgi:hypothetical protein